MKTYSIEESKLINEFVGVENYILPGEMSDWNHIMPLVEKIWECCDQYTATKFDFDSIERPLVKIDKEGTNKAVVEFIRWYKQLEA